MKNKKLVVSLIILLVIISIGLIIFMVSVMNKKISFKGFTHYYKVSNHKILDKQYEDKYKNIEINSNASDVYIKNTQDDYIRVVIYGEKDKLNVDESENLKIEFDEKKCIGFCFNQMINKIEVYLPMNYNKDLIINNNYGDIEIGETSSNIIIEEDAGDVEIKSGNQIKVNNKYGDIIIGRATSADISANCGDVEIDKVDSVSVNNKYGNIEINRVNEYMNLIDNCGDIEIEYLNISKNSKIKNDYGDIEIGHTNKIYIDAKTSLGDVSINHNYRKSEVTLDIKNDCGDIEIDN